MPGAIKIVLAGEGGQGVQTVAEMIAEAADAQGRQALYIPNFGVEQRGGVSVAYVQVSDKPIGSPKFRTGDVVVAMSGRAVSRTLGYLGPGTTFIHESADGGLAADAAGRAARVLSIPVLETAKNEFHPRSFNIIIMGAVIGVSEVITYDQAGAAMEEKFGYKYEKEPELREINMRALRRGMELVQESIH